MLVYYLIMLVNDGFQKIQNVSTWLKLEGLAVLTLSVILYMQFGGSWLLFALLILSPDLAMIGYGINKSIGATLYNLFHTYTAAAIPLGFGLLLGSPLLISLSIIWFAHIGMDRMLGYGLKLPTGFKDTHLGSANARHKNKAHA